LVDHFGLISGVVVSAANCNDRDGLRLLVNRLTVVGSLPTLIYADHGYTGEALKEWMEAKGSKLEIVGRAKGVDASDGKLKTVEGFRLVPKRWVVERTFAWLGRLRRLSKDYEYYPSSSESWIYLGMTRLMVRRMTRSHFDF
jgi:putative transposase